MFVAGEVIAAASGSTWDEFVRTRLFLPLGMTASTRTVRELDGRANVASLHARWLFSRVGRPRPLVDAGGLPVAAPSRPPP